MIRPNLNVLAWYTSLSEQNHRKAWTYGRAYPLICESGRVLPFQISRDTIANGISEVWLVNHETGAEIDIETSMAAAGLTIKVEADFDIIYFPSSSAITVTTPGQYYIRLTDSVNTWYSEVFQYCASTVELIKITYWHNENFNYPNGAINYDSPYKSIAWVESDIGKPNYLYEEQVTKRNGYNFPLQQISQKEFQFGLLVSEYLADAMRVIQLHDNVEIEYQGITYTVDEFEFDVKSWEDQGDLAEAQIKFKTDTVTVISGRGIGSTDFVTTPGSCFAYSHNPVGRETLGGTNYNNHQYVNSQSVLTDLIDGDLILLDETGPTQTRVYKYLLGSYSLQFVITYQIVWLQSTEEYFFIEGGAIQDPYIDTLTTNGTQWTVAGTTFSNTNVEIYVKDAQGNESFAGSGLSSGVSTNTFNGAGIVITPPSGSVEAQARSISPLCGSISPSAWFTLNDAPTASSYSVTSSSGTFESGATLTLNYSYSDGESDSEDTSGTESSVVWKTYTNSTGSAGATIVSTASLTFVPNLSHEGKYIEASFAPSALTGSTPGDTYTTTRNLITLSNLAPTAKTISITGTFSLGGLLTLNYTYDDTEGDLEDSTSTTNGIEWYRFDASAGTSGQVLTQTGGLTYTVQSGDTGKYMEARIKPYAQTGTIEGIIYTATRVAIDANLAPTISGHSITGSPDEGATLTLAYTYNDSEGDAQNISSTESSIIWKTYTASTGLSGEATVQTGGTTYVVQVADAGKYIEGTITPYATTGNSPGIAYTTARIEISSLAWSCSTTKQTSFTITQIGGVGDIDWGDGGSLEAFDASSGSTAIAHTYASAGTYNVKVYCVASDVMGLALTNQNLTGALDLSRLSSLTTIAANTNSALTSTSIGSGLLMSSVLFEDCDLASLDISGRLVNQDINVGGNANLITLTMNSTAQSLTSLYTDGTALTSLDISKITTASTIDIRDSPIATLTAGSSTFTKIIGSDTDVGPTLDLSSVGFNNSSTGFAFNNCPNLESITHKVSTGTFWYYQVYGCDIGYYDITMLLEMFARNSSLYYFHDNNMTATEVNHWLVDIDSIATSGYTGRVIKIGGTNASHDGTSGGYDGTTAYNNLITKGFTFS